MSALTQSFPKQRLSYYEKTKNDFQWGKDVLDQLALNYVSHYSDYTHATSHGNSYPNQSSNYQRKLTNYRLYNNILHQQDFEMELNPYGLEVGKYQDEIKPYNKTYNKINALLGEEIKRPFDYRVAVINNEGVREKLGMQDEILRRELNQVLDAVQSKVRQEVSSMMDQGQIDPQQQAAMEQELENTVNSLLDPKNLDRLVKTDMRNAKEHKASQILDYLVRTLDVSFKKNESFKHGLITGEQFTWVGIQNNEPVCEVLNPLGMFYYKPPEEPFIENGLYAGYRTLMDNGSVLDRFAQYLSDSDVRKIEDLMMGVNGERDDMMGKRMQYPDNDVAFNYQRQMVNNASHEGSYGQSRNIGEDWLVMHVEWRSQRKIYFLNFENIYGDKEVQLVSEEFVIPEYADQKTEIGPYGKKKKIWEFDGIQAEESYVPEVWSGIRIGDDVYCCIGPKKHQFRSLDNPHQVKLGYHGIVHSSMNAPTTCLMDRMKPFQYLYFVIMHRLRQMIARDKGKILGFDVSQVDPSIGLEKTLYYLEQLNIDFYNPMQNAELPGASQRGKAMEAVDWSNMQHIFNYIQLADAIDAQISEVAGVSRQREGQSQKYEAVTNYQQSIFHSSNVTEPYFVLHNKHWERVLNSMVAIASEHWQDEGMIKQYVLDDLSQAVLRIEPRELSDMDFGVFVTNSRQENDVFQLLRELGQTMLQHDKAKVSDIISIMKANSVAKLEREIKMSEDRMEEQMQEERAAQQQMQQQALEAQAQAQEAEQMAEDRRNTENNQTKIAVAEIQAMAKLASDNGDENENGVEDTIEREKLNHQRNVDAQKLQLEQQKINIQKSKPTSAS